MTPFCGQLSCCTAADLFHARPAPAHGPELQPSHALPSPSAVDYTGNNLTAVLREAMPMLHAVQGEPLRDQIAGQALRTTLAAAARAVASFSFAAALAEVSAALRPACTVPATEAAEWLLRKVGEGLPAGHILVRRCTVLQGQLAASCPPSLPAPQDGPAPVTAQLEIPEGLLRLLETCAALGVLMERLSPGQGARKGGRCRPPAGAGCRGGSMGACCLLLECAFERCKPRPPSSAAGLDAAGLGILPLLCLAFYQPFYTTTASGLYSATPPDSSFFACCLAVGTFSRPDVAPSVLKVRRSHEGRAGAAVQAHTLSPSASLVGFIFLIPQ